VNAQFRGLILQNKKKKSGKSTEYDESLPMCDASAILQPSDHVFELTNE